MDRGIQRLAERRGVLVPLERVLGERAEDDEVEAARDILLQLRGGERSLAHMLVSHRDGGVPRKG